MENVMIGFPDGHTLSKIIESGLQIEEYEYEGAVIGDDGLIRPGSVIYCDSKIGDSFKTGHNIVIREKTIIGNNVLIGTNTVIDGSTTIGTGISIQSNVYIPTDTIIEDNVFIGPNAVLTNDKYPIRKEYKLKGPKIKKGASIGANSTTLPDVRIGKGAMVAAGALVTKDVPDFTLAIGTPATMVDLPKELRKKNSI
ncbi:MAG: DapH/DapD/GlmU-related protein [Halobacteriota archaeon]|nr:DapH/DapD/GlmU-related protein [Halobacteriota archaeon]